MCKTNALQGLKHIPEKQQTGWKYQYEWNKQTNKQTWKVLPVYYTLIV